MKRRAKRGPNEVRQLVPEVWRAIRELVTTAIHIAINPETGDDGLVPFAEAVVAEFHKREEKIRANVTDLALRVAERKLNWIYEDFAEGKISREELCTRLDGLIGSCERVFGTKVSAEDREIIYTPNLTDQEALKKHNVRGAQKRSETRIKILTGRGSPATFNRLKKKALPSRESLFQSKQTAMIGILTEIFGLSLDQAKQEVAAMKARGVFRIANRASEPKTRQERAPN